MNMCNNKSYPKCKNSCTGSSVASTIRQGELKEETLLSGVMVNVGSSDFGSRPLEETNRISRLLLRLF